MKDTIQKLKESLIEESEESNRLKNSMNQKEMIVTSLTEKLNQMINDHDPMNSVNLQFNKCLCIKCEELQMEYE